MIVCGLGQVGYRVAILLARLGEEVTIITLKPREEFLELVTDAGCRVILGDARNERYLVEAGVASAGAVVACIDDDLTNIEIALDARRLNAEVRVVARVFDQSLAQRVEQTLGVHRAFGMSILAAPAFAAAAMGESLRGAFYLDGTSYVVGRLGRDVLQDAQGNPHVIHNDVDGGWAEVLFEQHNFAALSSRPAAPRPVHSAMRRLIAGYDPRGVGRTLRTIWRNAPSPLKAVALTILLLTVISFFVFHFGMHLSAIDSIYFVITTVTTVGYGDITPKDSTVWLKLYGCLLMLLGTASVATLYSILTDFVVSLKFDQMFGRGRVASAEHVVVVGLGSVGFRTIEELRRMRYEVVAVDSRPDAEFRSALPDDVAFVAGDARDMDTLNRAGIDQATAVLALTDNDAVNLSISLLAKRLSPMSRSVVRLFNAQFAEKVRGAMDVDSAISASRIAAPSFVGAALFDDALLCYVDRDRFIVVRDARSGTKTDITWTSADGRSVNVLNLPLKPYRATL